MYDIRLYSFKNKTNYMDFTQEHEGFVRTNDNVKVISVTIHEFNIDRCKNLYDGVEVEDINTTSGWVYYGWNSCRCSLSSNEAIFSYP